jgi:hypothetical protein
LIEQIDEWIVSRRYLSAEPMALILNSEQTQESTNQEVIELNPA